MKRKLRKSIPKQKNHKTLIVNASLITLIVVSSLLMIFYKSTMAAPNNLPDNITVTNADTGSDPFNPGHNSYEQHNMNNLSELVYCYERGKELMGTDNTVVSYKRQETDAGLVYILEHGYNTRNQIRGLCEGCTTHDEYMITQQAIWVYKKDHLKESDADFSRDDIVVHDNVNHTYSIGPNNTKYSQAVLALLQGAENARKTAGNNYNISLNGQIKITAASNGQAFETSQIGISTAMTSGSYKVSIEAPNGYYIVTSKGATIKDANAIANTSFDLKDTFKIVVPITSLTSGSLTIKVKAVSNFTKNSLAIYEPTDPTIQSGLFSVLVPSIVQTEASGQATIPTGKLKVIKTSKDEEGKVEYVKGAKLKISSTDDTSFSEQEWVTDGTFKEFANLIPGKTYTITEVEAASGYINNSSKKTYTLTAADSYTSGNNIAVIEMKNEYTKLQVGKIDINTAEYIEGATLVIKSVSDGKEFARIVTTKEPTYITKIPVGQYILEEVEAPEGYILSQTKVLFEVTNTGGIQQSFIKNSYTKVSVAEQKITVSMAEKGFQIEIRDAKGKVVDSFVTTGKPYTTKQLPVGKYTIIEVEAAEGYTCMPTPIDVYVPEIGTDVPDIIFSNDYTKVKFSKVDITNEKELPGAELEIHDSKDKVIEKWTSTETPHEIDHLPAGKYTLVETVAPKGYILSKTAVNFEIKETGDVQMVTMKNEPKVEVPNTASNSNVITYVCGGVIILCGIGLIVYNVIERKKKRK